MGEIKAKLPAVPRMKKALSLINVYKSCTTNSFFSLYPFREDATRGYFHRFSAINICTVNEHLDNFHETQSEIEFNKSLQANTRKADHNSENSFATCHSHSEPTMKDTLDVLNKTCRPAPSDLDKNSKTNEQIKRSNRVDREPRKHAGMETHETPKHTQMMVILNSKVHDTKAIIEEFTSFRTATIISERDEVPMVENYIESQSVRKAYETAISTCKETSDESFHICEAISSNLESELSSNKAGAGNEPISDNDREERKQIFPFSSEESVWIQRSNFSGDLDLETGQIESKKTNSVRVAKPPEYIRGPPRFVILLFLLGAIVNPVLAPAGIYLLLKSKRARSKHRYYSADRFLYQAGGVTITGIIFTLTTILLILTFVPRNKDTTDKMFHRYTTTSDYLKQSNVVQSAGERFLKKIKQLSQPNSNARHDKRTTYRSGKRTSSPKQVYTKPRHSFHRFVNAYADNTKANVKQTLYPTKMTETTISEHISDVMKEGVAKKGLQLTFRNRTVSVYFEPVKNKTIVVHIPDFLQ